MRGEFKGMYDMERGSTEVKFEDDLEPMKSEILTCRNKEGMKEELFHTCRMEGNVIRKYKCEEWGWYMGGIVIEKIWRLRR